MSRKGFTILEILIVVSVIAILLAVVSPRVKGMQDEANVAKARAELKTLQAAVESYKNNHSNALPTFTTDAIFQQTMIDASPQLIAASLSDPFEAAGTLYQQTQGGVYYVIWSTGINGTTGTSIHATSGAVTKGSDDICITNGTGC